MMSRRDDIESAFRAAIEMDARGRQIVTTDEFCRQLAKRNHSWSHGECNKWIEYYQSGFKDLTPYENVHRIFALRNMAYVR
jgi:hypothetical protein